ncbi:Hemicentin-1 [Merluccius polli]|uniref:B-cell receptor CD22 n=1 Tax=Merluccius polli TaxID=89951 RepID=A0AA47MTU7_MERPO|nr:Hemicentin-1 [Merluccius polli]
MKCNSTDAPKTTSAAVSTSGEIEEGRSVTLSCSSDANPAANYTWFKVNTDHSSRDMIQGQQLVFGAILSSDSGQYLCKAKNELGTTSDSISINVKYGPKNTSVISSPSGEIEEGRSVNTDHSSRDMIQGQQLVFGAILSSDSGQYLCKAKNEFGTTSDSISINVKYGPKNTSVISSPSGEIEEGRSVTLSCSSDANPAANYTWFKEHEDSVGDSGQNYTITHITSQLGGNYYCQAHNAVGRHNSTFLFIHVTDIITDCGISCWWNRCRLTNHHTPPHHPLDESLPVPVYGNVLPLTNRTAPVTRREPIEERDDLHYASVHISRSKNQEVPLCMAGSRVQSDQTDEGNNDWTVTYTSSNVCSARGSTVYITCTYRYPDKLQYRSSPVETLWFTKGDNKQPVDLLSDTDYAGRVEYTCGEISCYRYNCRGRCTLRIRDLRQSDSAVYKFRFITNQPGGQHTGEPGVTLSVTDPDLQVKVNPSHHSSWVKLKCDSTCGLAGYPAYIWYKNGQSVGGKTTRYYGGYLKSEDSYSCAVEGYEHLHSPLVCKSTPQYTDKIPDLMDLLTTSATVSPSGEIEEGRSVTLSCSSDANPAANYTWFKVNTDQSSRDMIQGQQLVFGAILSSDSGQYLCKAKNELGTTSDSISINVKYGPKNTFVISSPSVEIEEGRSVNTDHSSRDMNQGQQLVFGAILSSDSGQYLCKAKNEFGTTSDSISINVKYGPKNTSVISSPSGEIEEGRSVTLSCSSDANPAANYTWFKEHEDSVGESGQNYTITHITSQLGGNYYCQAHNGVGHHNSTFLFIHVTDTLSLSLDIDFCCRFFISVLFTRRKMVSRKASGLGGRPDAMEESLPVPVYDNVLPLTNRMAPAAQREPIEERDDLHYASVHISRSKNQEVPLCMAGSRVQSDQTDECNDDWTVTYTSSNVCSARGSTVDITCTYRYPEKLQYRSSLWFTKEDNKQPVNLLSDTDYAGRVEYTCGGCKRYNCRGRCTLRIRDLRQSDSAVYKFRFITNQPDPDLQVKVSPSHHSSWVYLTCDSTCGLAGYPAYIWYKNGQSVRGQTTWYYGDYLNSEDSYSCAVEGYEHLHSPLVCKSTPQYTDKIPDVMDLLVIPTCIMNGQTDHVLAAFRLWVPVDRYYTLWKDCGGVRGDRCNRVSYPTRNMCVLRGTSVDISCTYNSYSYNSYQAFIYYIYWFKWRDNQQPWDLQTEYEGRVEYPAEETGRSTLRITDLRDTDSAEYRFTFKSSSHEWKGLRVEVTPVATVTEGQRVTLTCMTSCPLTDKPSYMWYQNNGPVTGPESPENQLVLDPVSPRHAGNYACSVRNYTHLRSPEETLTVQCTMSILHHT